MQTPELPRRSLLKSVLAGAVVASICGTAFAQQYPSRPIRLISPWSAGGTSDIVLRAFAQGAAKHLGGTFVVENKPGAGGTLGAVELAGAKPDGYTLSQVAMSVISLPMMQKMSYDPLRDLTYIARLAVYTNGFVVRADSSYKSLADVIAYAKANPDRFTYASSGVGSTPHLIVEEFSSRAGVTMRNIPYKGDSDSLQALMSSTVMAISGAASWGAHVDAGTLRLLAVYGTRRATRWPSAPTLAELGYPVPDTPFGVAGPSGMDPAIVARLEEAFRKSMDDAEVKAMLAKVDMPAAFLGAADYTRSVAAISKGQKVMIDRMGLGIAK